jgi:hypothetical protein
MFERDDRDTHRRMMLAVHGIDLPDDGPPKPGQTKPRTGLRSFHDRIARKLKGRR